MQSLKIDILNPQAAKLLQDLAELKLISIRSGNTSFTDILKKLRSKSGIPSLKEITKEVETVRAK